MLSIREGLLLKIGIALALRLLSARWVSGRESRSNESPKAIAGTGHHGAVAAEKLTSVGILMMECDVYSLMYSSLGLAAPLRVSEDAIQTLVTVRNANFAIGISAGGLMTVTNSALFYTIILSATSVMKARTAVGICSRRILYLVGARQSPQREAPAAFSAGANSSVSNDMAQVAMLMMVEPDYHSPQGATIEAAAAMIFPAAMEKEDEVIEEVRDLELWNDERSRPLFQAIRRATCAVFLALTTFYPRQR
jgi:hypothetical protein